MVGIASAEDQAIPANARTLSKQEVLDLISNKKIIYMTKQATSASDGNEGSLQLDFTKTEESGGTLTAYAHGRVSGSSSGGKWYVRDDSRLVRQYDKVTWGNKPFQSRIVEKNGKYFVRFGAAEDHEIVKIE
jgi:hypothetical protein